MEGDERCLPACTMRRSAGCMLVRRARSERSVLIDVLAGSVRGIVLLPETVLTKICIVSSASEPDELMLEMLDVRCMVAGRERVVVVRESCLVVGGDDAVVAELGPGQITEIAAATTTDSKQVGSRQLRG